MLPAAALAALPLLAYLRARKVRAVIVVLPTILNAVVMRGTVFRRRSRQSFG